MQKRLCCWLEVLVFTGVLVRNFAVFLSEIVFEMIQSPTP
jgi:hypothetical protein